MIRRACVLAALFGLLLQGSSGGHMLLVEHTRCAAHGELAHHGEAHHNSPGTHAEPSALAFQSVSGEASGEAHEHCALTADRRDGLPSVGDALASATAVAVFSTAPPVDLFSFVAAKRFRLAPKNSPPA